MDGMDHVSWSRWKFDLHYVSSYHLPKANGRNERARVAPD